MDDWKKWEWLGNHKILRRITVSGEVKNIEPLIIGSGRTRRIRETTYSLVLKYRTDKGETIVIPGSSWKGVFRATANRIMMINNLYACSGLPRETCLKGKEFEEIEKNENLDFISSIRAKIESIISNKIQLCLLCRIFGSPGYFSHVTFMDSFPINTYKLGYRTMVAINRRTGAAYKRALYSVEYVEPGTLFNFKFIAFNLPNYAVGLLAEVLMEIHHGIVKIGGLKSRGFGRVKFEKINIDIYNPETKSKEIIKALDPYDEDIKYTSDSWKLIEEFRRVWRNVSKKLQKV